MKVPYEVPNLLTIAGAFCTVSAVGFVDKLHVLAVLALLALGQACDVADGWVARRYLLETRFGAELDLTCDRVLTHAIGFAMAGSFWFLLVPPVVYCQVWFQRMFSGRALAALVFAVAVTWRAV